MSHFMCCYMPVCLFSVFHLSALEFSIEFKRKKRSRLLLSRTTNWTNTHAQHLHNMKRSEQPSKSLIKMQNTKRCQHEAEKPSQAALKHICLLKRRRRKIKRNEFDAKFMHSKCYGQNSNRIGVKFSVKWFGRCSMLCCAMLWFARLGSHDTFVYFFVSRRHFTVGFASRSALIDEISTFWTFFFTGIKHKLASYGMSFESMYR